MRELENQMSIIESQIEEIKIKEDFIDTIQNCKEIKLEEWNKRKLSKKVLEAILRLISPLL